MHKGKLKMELKLLTLSSYYGKDKENYCYLCLQPRGGRTGSRVDVMRYLDVQKYFT